MEAEMEAQMEKQTVANKVPKKNTPPKRSKVLRKNKGEAVDWKGKMEAINRTQATIEFNLDGTVITANENFLSCLGYSLQDIKGQHHRMFCEPAYTSSPEYAAFWQ
ncbi:MAG: PAS domain-containing protein, partial [Nitrospira sp.]